MKSPFPTTTDTKRETKNHRNTPEGRIKYREINKNIRNRMKEAKEEWIKEQCLKTEENLARHVMKKAYQMVNDLTKKKQYKVSIIQDKKGIKLSERYDIRNRWREYCAELYIEQPKGDPTVLKSHDSTNEDNYPILREEVKAAVRSSKKGNLQELIISQQN